MKLRLRKESQSRERKKGKIRAKEKGKRSQGVEGRDEEKEVMEEKTHGDSNTFDLETRSLFFSSLCSSLLFTSPRMGFRYFCGVMLDGCSLSSATSQQTKRPFSSLPFAPCSLQNFTHISPFLRSSRLSLFLHSFTQCA